MGKKAWLIFAAAVVVLLGSLIYLSNKNKVSIDVSNVTSNSVIAATEQSGGIGDHAFGNTDNKVILVEYGDFQCPGCGGMYPTVKELTEKYKGELTFVFRNFPITSIHPNARAAAAVAEAAGKQGKYWEMHDKLYEGQKTWENLRSDKRTEFFEGYARDLGLNTETFMADLASTSVNQKINFDQALAKKDNVTSTPTFYLDGKLVSQDTWGDKTKFEAAITDALKAKGLTPKTTE